MPLRGLRAACHRHKSLGDILALVLVPWVTLPPLDTRNLYFFGLTVKSQRKPKYESAWFLLFWRWWKAPSLTPVVMCCSSSSCPPARCPLCCATRALHTCPVKPELCFLPYAMSPELFLIRQWLLLPNPIPQPIGLQLRSEVYACMRGCVRWRVRGKMHLPKDESRKEMDSVVDNKHQKLFW